MGAPHSSMGFIMVIPHFHCSIVNTKYIVIKNLYPGIGYVFSAARVFVQFYVVYSIFRFVFHLVMCLTTFVDFHELISELIMILLVIYIGKEQSDKF